MSLAQSPQELTIENVAETVEDLLKNKVIHAAEGCITTIDNKLYVIVMGAAVSLSGNEGVRELPMDFHVEPMSTSYRSRSFNLLDAAITNRFSGEMLLMAFHYLEILHHEVLEIWKGDNYDSEGMVGRLQEQINEIPAGLEYLSSVFKQPTISKEPTDEENND